MVTAAEYGGEKESEMISELFESLVQKLPERWFQDKILLRFCQAITWVMIAAIAMAVVAIFGLAIKLMK